MKLNDALIAILITGWFVSSAVIGASTLTQPPLTVALDYLEVQPPECLTDSECDDLAED